MSAPLPCLHSLTFSAFNPPPGNRKLRGDLLYLQAQTLEGHTLHITAAIDGFFVNSSSSSSFSPAASPSSYASHSLVDLLRKASPLFASRFNSLIARRLLLHPFQQAEVTQPPVQWLRRAEQWSGDEGRAEDALLDTFGLDVGGVMRDWNEEYQSCVEMECASEEDRLRRDAHLHRVYAEFRQAAEAGVAAIIAGHVAPVNALDPPRQHVFIFNSIFFSHALDSRDVYPAVWGDSVLHKQADADLHGVETVLNRHLPSLHTLATAIVDHRGHRLLCQSIIPGIFHCDRASKHVYGSMDQGETLLNDETMHRVMTQAALVTHTAEHDVWDAAGQRVRLATAVDTKGIIGSDHRCYALDLLRTTPRDANRREAKYVAAVLRSKLVERYVRRVAMDALFDTPPAAAAAAAAAAGERQDGQQDGGDDGGKEERQLRLLLEQQMAGNRELDRQYIATINGLTFHPDLFLHTKHALLLHLPQSELQQHEEQAQRIASFLTSSVIPEFVAAAASLELVPADGEDLTRLLHDSGINMRYLGALCRESERKAVPYLQRLCVQEMVVRAVKAVVREEMREVGADGRGGRAGGRGVESWYHGSVVVRALNGLLSRRGLGVGVGQDEYEAGERLMQTHREDREKERTQDTEAGQTAGAPGAAPSRDRRAAAAGGKKGKKATAAAFTVRLNDGRKANVDPLSPVNLWVCIRQAVQDRFDYALPASLPLSSPDKLVLLRSVCRRLGIVLTVRELELSGEEPLTLDDIADVLPVVKGLEVSNEEAEQLVASAVASLQQQHLSFAYQYLSDALNAHNALYGPMHARTAYVYQLLALVCYHAGDIGAAVDFQQRCLIIAERCLGADDARTAAAHMALALYLHGSGAQRRGSRALPARHLPVPDAGRRLQRVCRCRLYERRHALPD